MMLAMLIPRPAAEVAISRVPWQAGSPGDNSASRMSVLRDGGEEQQDPAKGTPGTTTDQDGVASNEPGDGKQSQPSENSQSEAKNAGQQSSAKGGSDGRQSDGESNSQKGTGKSGDSKAGSETSTSSGEQSQSQNDGDSSQSANSQQGADQTGDQQAGSQARSDQQRQSGDQPNESSAQRSTQAAQPAHPQTSPPPPMSNPLNRLGGLAGLLKILFYAAIALCIAFLAWKYRHEILRAIADILSQLRQLFGGKASTATAMADDASAPATRRPTFADFGDPFARGQQSSLPPEELVRYTFAAFEAWASDRGSPRSPDCTPQEFVSMVVEPQTPMHAEARRLVGLYSQVAYASKRLPRESVNDLQALWQIMRGMNTGRS
jgi:hypothetical protein